MTASTVATGAGVASRGARYRIAAHAQAARGALPIQRTANVVAANAHLSVPACARCAAARQAAAASVVAALNALSGDRLNATRRAALA